MAGRGVLAASARSLAGHAESLLAAHRLPPVLRRASRPNTSDLSAQALEVRKDNPAMPMVIVTCPGIVSNGFAKTLKRPGGIYTGIDELPPGVTAKRLSLLKTN